MPWFGDGSHHSSGLIYFFGLTYTRIKGGFYMDTQYYKEFTQLALEKNFSRAAASLHMSHTMLHRHISMMEKEVGAPLIIRTTPIKLTAIGRKVLEKASIIAAEEGEILKIVKRDRASVSGEVRVLVPSFMSTATEVASALYTVKKRHPEIALIIVNSLDDSSVSQGLLADKIDIGLSHRFFKTGCDVACEKKSDKELDPKTAVTRLSSLDQRLRFCIKEDHPLFDAAAPALAELVAAGVVFPATKTYENGVASFRAMCEAVHAPLMCFYAEVGTILELWLEYQGRGSFIMGENARSNPILPSSFFDDARIVAPADDDYWVSFDALSRTDDDSAAVRAVLDILYEMLNK